MKPKEYINKVQELLEMFDGICANPSEHTKLYYYIDLDDWSREFRHLVYSFDPNLPLNKELENPNVFVLHVGGNFDEEVARIRKYVTFFMHYIETYL